MAKISEEERSALERYARKKGDDDSLGANSIASSYCHTKEEVDAVYKCTQIMEQNRLLYLKAVDEAPHNVKSNMNQRQTMYDEYDTPVSRDTAVAIQRLYPLTSDTKTIKDEINDLCRDVLVESGSIGKKRLNKMMAGLKFTLTDEEEEFDQTKKEKKYTEEYKQFLKDMGIS